MSDFVVVAASNRRGVSAPPPGQGDPKRRRRIVIVAAAALVVAVGIAVAAFILVPRWMNFDANGLPKTVAVDGVGPLAEAQESFRAEFGRYAPSLTELETKGAAPFVPPANLWFLTNATEDGSGFIAQTRAANGTYAVLIVTTGSRSQGGGATPEEALTAAGWDADKLREAGFPTGMTRTSFYGAQTVRDDRILSFVLNPEDGTSVASIAPVPRSGHGDSWQDAVLDAGGDPNAWEVTFTPASEMRTVRGDDGASLSLAAGANGVDALLTSPARTSDRSKAGPAAVEQLGIGSDLGDVHGSFRCVTSSSPNGVHSATLCEDVAGVSLVYATTGKAMVGGAGAFTQIGADPAWAARVGLRLPTSADLF